MSAHVTSHATERGRERLGLHRNALERTAEIALREGFRHGDTSGQLKRYLDKLFLSHRTANNLRIHGEQVFIFSGITLITVHPVPANLRGALHKLRTNRAKEVAP